MPILIGWQDGGRRTITERGKDYDCGVIHFLTQENDQRPVVITGYCKYDLKESILKYLGKMFFPRPEFDTTQHRPQIDRDEFIEALQCTARNAAM